MKTFLAIILALVAGGFLGAAWMWMQPPPGSAPRITDERPGHATGNAYMAMTDAEKAAYALGVTEGLLQAPALGAPAAGVQWLADCVADRDNLQLWGDIQQYFYDHPDHWTDRLGSSAFTALQRRCQPGG